MILIAGISPKTKVLDQNPRRCPVCGLYQAFYKRIDHYFSIFFIPVFRVKKGEPFVMCDRCERTIPESGFDVSKPARDQERRCRYCGKAIDSYFKYCPYCGKRI